VISWRPTDDTWYVPQHGDIRVGDLFIDGTGEIFIIINAVKAGWSMLQGFDILLRGKKRFITIRDIKQNCRIVSRNISLPSSGEL